MHKTRAGCSKNWTQTENVKDPLDKCNCKNGTHMTSSRKSQSYYETFNLLHGRWTWKVPLASRNKINEIKMTDIK